MGCDMVVALGGATVSGAAFVGANNYDFGLPESKDGLRYLPAREHAVGEMLSFAKVQILEARQTQGVLGFQPSGAWGLRQGCNDQRLVVGMASWKSRLEPTPGGLLGTDLVRLTLERGQSARHGLEILTELIERHGQAAPNADHLFLLADPRESFVVEAAGNNWALLQCHLSRAVCDVGLIHQDWQRLSRGLAELVLDKHWWPNDGTKINFHTSLAESSLDESKAMRRWSRATLALAQQEGAIDPYFLRRMLQEHFDACLKFTPETVNWPSADCWPLPADARPRPRRAGERGRPARERRS